MTVYGNLKTIFFKLNNQAFDHLCAFANNIILQTTDFLSTHKHAIETNENMFEM